MELTHTETIALMAGLTQLTEFIAEDTSPHAVVMREAIKTARAKLILERNIDAEWRK